MKSTVKELNEEILRLRALVDKWEKDSNFNRHGWDKATAELHIMEAAASGAAAEAGRLNCKVKGLEMERSSWKRVDAVVNTLQRLCDELRRLGG